MSTDSVKFLNRKCLLKANVDVSDKLFDGDKESRRDLADEIRYRLARILGESILADRATRTVVHDVQRMEHVYRAEVYVLSLADAKRLYDLIRAEVRGGSGDEVARLEEAKEAAARADVKATELYEANQEFSERAAKRLMKIRKQEQQIQTQGNTIAKQADMIERMNVQIRELEQKAANAAHGPTAVETIERMKSDLLEIYESGDQVKVGSIIRGFDIAIYRAKRGLYP